MRHRKRTIKLHLNSPRRKNLFRNIMISLFEHEQIKTTLARAKALRSFAEPMITLARSDTLAARRIAFSRLRSRSAVKKLFDDIAPRFIDRPGGYLRLVKNGFRAGDNAPMAIVELVERKDTYSSEAADSKASVTDTAQSTKKNTKK